MIGFSIASAGLFLAGQALAGEPAPWRAVDAETGQIRDVDALERLASDFPDSGNVRLRLLQPYLGAGEIEKVMETLEWLYDRGYVFSDVAQTQIPKLLEGVDPGRIAERLRAEAEVIDTSTVVATYPASAGLLETVVRFPKNIRMNISPRPKFLATSVMDKYVTALFPAGTVIHFQSVRPDNVSGMVWDEDRRSLWIASGNIDGSERDGDEFSGLFRLMNVEEPQRQKITAPVGVSPSDMAVGPDGTLYTSDPIGGGVYRAGLEQDKLEPLVAPGTFRSPQGLALSADNTKLYVSDYRYGIAIVDLASGELSRLASDIPVILDGVDGLWRYGNELIAVQNGTSPMRISAFELSEDGNMVIGHRVLEQASPEWTEPLGGSIDGDALIYVGNGQWGSYIEGELAVGKEPLPTQIHRLPLEQVRAD